MKQDLFTKLPPEIILVILLRLSVRTTIICKLVCKSLLKLVGSHEFAKCRVSKSTPGLCVLQAHQFKNFTIYEIVDGLDLELHELHCYQLTQFYVPFDGWICGSANGLLLLSLGSFGDGLYVCNPVTREYIKLHYPHKLFATYHYVSYGIGESKYTNQYKVVGVIYDFKHDSKPSVPIECQVYTLGTRSWRRIEPGPACKYGGWPSGVFLNGNLHWLVYDLNGSNVISCFDLETELFSTFSIPMLPIHGKARTLAALSDCLCLSDSSRNSETDIWLMKEYGVEKSWTKEYVINNCGLRRHHDIFVEIVHPVKIFRDGGLLATWNNFYLFYYSSKAKTARQIYLLSLSFEQSFNSISITLSFFSLKNFSMEKVEFI